MTAQLFPVLFDMSLGASFVIAAVLLLRLFWHRFPRRYFLILWAVVLLRLLCPILPESELSVIPPETLSFAKETALPERSEVTVLSAADAAMRAVGDTLNGGIDTVYVKLDREVSGREPTDQNTIPAVTAYHDQIWLLFLEKLWLGGIAVLVLRQIILDIRLRRRLNTAIPYPADIPAGLLPHRIRVYLADNIPTAFVLGILRPTIYLPSDISRDAAVYVLAHESVHVRRLDPLWKLLSAVALCLHWFNPLVWAAYFCASADLEYACDEIAPKLLSKVLPEADDNMTASYAQALLNVSTGKARLGMLVLGWGNVPRRIRRLLCDTPKRVFCIMLLVICIVVCLFCIGNPPTQFDASDVRMCTLDGTSIPAEQGKVLVDAINDAARSHNRTYDASAVGRTALDRNAVVTFADGSYLEINYLYTSGYSFHPAHAGEDDYTTVLWHRDARGKTVGTWVMEYDFDAVFRNWMTDSKTLSIDSYDWYFERGFISYASSEQTIELYHPALQPETQESVPMTVVLMRREEGEGSRYEFITGDWDTNRSTLEFRLRESDNDTVQYDVDVYRDTGEFLHTVTAVMERQGDNLPPVLTLSSNTEDGNTQWIFTADRLETENNGTAQLTLDDVIRLSKWNVGLTWEDFAPYKSIETGSGLYIRVYEIDETFELWIGGGSPIGTPMYIYLARVGDLDTRIDIRYGGVEAFIEEQTASNLNTVIDIHDLSYTKVRFKHKDSNGQTIHAELKLALPNEWDIAYGFNAYEVIPFAEYAVIQNGEDAVGGVGFLPYSVPDDQAEIREAIFNQIAMGGMSFWDIRGHFDVVTDQTTPYCTALTTVLYSSDLFNDGIDRKNSAIVTYHPEYQLYFAIQFNDGIQNRTLLTEDALRMIAQSIEWVTVRYSDTGNEKTEQSALFQKTVTFLKDEFHRVYDPYYDILNLSIFDWTETGTEATFLYTMSFQYRDEQFSDLSPSESNIYFKVIENGDTIDLFCNVSPTDVEWEPCKIDDFVNHN